STALALERLGPGYRFVTRITFDGDLRLVGGGDPTLSARIYPYKKDADNGDPLVAIETLADELVKRGISNIAGDVIGDDSAYVYTPYPEGWTIDDATWEYGAPVSALVFNDNAFSLLVRPGEEIGAPARIAISPAAVPVFIDNRVITADGDRSRIEVRRAPGSRQLRVSGTVVRKNGNRRELLAVDDAALYGATALYDALTRRGVSIQGKPVATHRYSASDPLPNAGTELMRRESP